MNPAFGLTERERNSQNASSETQGRVSNLTYTAFLRKHSGLWSLTIPTACIQA
jgi:hypothetical protein